MGKIGAETEIRQVNICMDRDLLWSPAPWLSTIVVIKSWLERCDLVLFLYYAKGTVHL